MSIENTLCKGPITDDSDVARINRLITRYSYICDASEEQQVGDFKTDKNDATNTSPVLGRSTNPIQAYPMMNNYFYKIHSNESSVKESDDDDYINTTCEYCKSFHSRCFDTESNIPKTGHKSSKVGSVKSKTKVTFQDQIKDVEQQTSFTGEEFHGSRIYAEKTTYCRPVNKTYDNNFVHGVIEKNAKLQLLLTKFVIARQKEKEKEMWSAYVQNLMEKRRRYTDISTQNSPPRKLQQVIKLSDSSQEILQDLYSPKNDLNLENSPENEEGKPFNNNTIKRSNNDKYCFPCTSRVIKKIQENHDSLCDKTLYGSSIEIGNRKKKRKKPDETDEMPKYGIYSPRLTISTKNINHQFGSSSDIKPEIKQSKVVQTYITFGEYSKLATYFKNELEPTLRITISEIHVAIRNKNEMEEKFKSKETHDKATEYICRLTPKKKVMGEDLENQLTRLNDLFKSFILDYKRKGSLSEESSSNKFVDTSDSNKSSNSAQNNTPIETKNKKSVIILGSAVTSTSFCGFKSQSTTSQHLLNSRLDEKLDNNIYDDLDKSNKLKKEIVATLNHTTYRQCAVQISNIPSKERSTEVTDSLSKTKLSESRSKTIISNDVISPTECHVAKASQKCDEVRQCVKRRVAVNTEPMGLAALLKFSTEAVKQILSFVPNMNRWYFPGENLPAAQTANYVCNVCGALFARQSHLCAHILEHKLGQGRDCCVSRQAQNPQLEIGFRCEYCGQRFQRSYCCELHQHICARQLGRHHHSSDLVMLR